MGFVKTGENYAGFRVNFASYNNKLKMLDRRTARDLTGDELQTLTQELRSSTKLSTFDNIHFDIVAFRRHRGIISFKSETTSLNGNVTNTDPGFLRVGVFGIPVENYKPIPKQCLPVDASAGAKNVARLVNEFVCESSMILNNSIVNKKRIKRGKLPANILLFRDGGKQTTTLPSFEEKFCCLVSLYGQMPAEKGIMELINGKFTYSVMKEENKKSYYRKILQQVITDKSDVIVVHLKGPDEPGHDRLPLNKVKAIEDIDEYFITDC